jgi:hypothetical protein
MLVAFLGRVFNGLLDKRVRRIELLSLAWKAKVLPLNYTRTEIFQAATRITHL